tara:strand:+ start:99 stop:317 length:219 start_codon:yes stop_codon:yes gene_type:complete
MATNDYSRDPGLRELLANLDLFERMRVAVLQQAADAYLAYRDAEDANDADDALRTYRRSTAWLAHYAEGSNY